MIHLIVYIHLIEIDLRASAPLNLGCLVKEILGGDPLPVLLNGVDQFPD